MGAEWTAERLRRCAASRDNDEWEAFCERFEGLIQFAVRKMLRSWGLSATPDRVEDLTQEVYCRLLSRSGQRLSRCRAGDARALGSYLLRLSQNVVVSALRKLHAEKRAEPKAPERADEEGHWSTCEWIAEPGPSPESRCLSRELSSELYRTCRTELAGRNPKRNLEVFELAVLAGWSAEEIARHTPYGLTPTNVNTLVSRQRQRLALRGLLVPFRRGRG